MSQNVGNFRSAMPSEPRIMGGPSIMQTPFGNVVTNQPISSMPPPLPPPIGMNRFASSYVNPGYNSFGGMGNFMGYGSGFSPYGGGYGYYGNSFSNSYGNYQNDPEGQFIRLAEESSRPAFQSIQSFVSAIANIATLLDSTFFAITSSFRAILGVAANFGRLRGVFAQFWTTFAVLRWMNRLYRKILYALKISNVDPSTIAFTEAFAAAQGVPKPPQNQKSSPWPVLAFISFIFTAPYLIMKLLKNVTNSALEESRNPRTWVQPIPCRAVFDFQPTNPGELSIRNGQQIWVAPKEVQNTHQLLGTGWALATVDSVTSGLIPLAYVKKPYQAKQEDSTIPDAAPQPASMQPNIQPEDFIAVSDPKLKNEGNMEKLSEDISQTSVSPAPEKRRDKSPEKPICVLPPIPEINEALST